MCPPPAQMPRISLSRKIRCLLVHDHVLLRQGLRRLLEDEPDLDVVGEAGNAAECLRKVFEFQPDVVLADAGTFGLAGSEAELLVTRECPDTKLVFWGLHEQGPPAFGGVRTGIRYSAVRQTSVEELIKIVRNVCRTGPICWESAPPYDLRNSAESPPSHERALTTREREVLKLLAEGKTVRAAATDLGLSSKTVDAHKFNLMRKLGIHNKAELVMWAIQNRLVKIPASF